MMDISSFPLGMDFMIKMITALSAASYLSVCDGREIVLLLRGEARHYK